jgi:hypothetical protein
LSKPMQSHRAPCYGSTLKLHIMPPSWMFSHVAMRHPSFHISHLQKYVDCLASRHRFHSDSCGQSRP